MSQTTDNFENESNSSDDTVTNDLTGTLSESEFSFVAEEKPARGSGSVVLFALVLAAAGATYFMYWKTGPSSAVAATVESKEATTTIKTFLTEGHVSLKAMEEMRKNTEKVVERFTNYPSMTQVPLADLKSNPFRMLPPTPTADATEATERRRREQLRDVTVKAVQSLALQSVIVSDVRSACMINNTLFTEGQQVDIFVIEKIVKNAVIVQANGFRFELKMTR